MQSAEWATASMRQKPTLGGGSADPRFDVLRTFALEFETEMPRLLRASDYLKEQISSISQAVADRAQHGFE
jgi:hypothetical protein